MSTPAQRVLPIPPDRAASAPPAARAASTSRGGGASFGASRKRVRRNRLINYIANVLLIAVLVAPFVVFTSPRTMQEAVGGSDHPALVAPAVAEAPVAQASVADAGK